MVGKHPPLVDTGTAFADYTTMAISFQMAAFTSLVHCLKANGALGARQLENTIAEIVAESAYPTRLDCQLLNQLLIGLAATSTPELSRSIH